MINNKRVLAIIPARGGSKGIPNKNLALLGNKPLIAWTIEAAKKSKYLDRLILSSDDPRIIEAAKGLDCDVPFVRPANLALDTTPGIDVVIHAIEFFKDRYDIVVLLQPTSPFRSSIDIDASVEFAINADSTCVSVTQPDKSPYWMYSMEEDKKLVPLLKTEAVRRQDLPEVYALNGAVYVASVQDILTHKTFITPKTIGYAMHSTRSLDIDTPLDLLFAEALLSSGYLNK